MKKIKRLLVLAMSLCLTTGLWIIPIKANETDISEEKDFANDKVNIIYDTEELSKMDVSNEFESYVLIIDKINNLAVINDTKVYSMDDYVTAAIQQSENKDPSFLKYLDNKSYSINKTDYDQLYSEITEPVIHEDHNISTIPGIGLFCTSCGLDPYSAPTTGYGDKGYNIKIHNFTFGAGIVLSLGTATLNAIATKLGATYQKAQKMVLYFVEMGIGWGTSLAGGRRVMQYYHLICPKAVKTEELIEGEAQGTTVIYYANGCDYTYFEKPF